MKTDESQLVLADAHVHIYNCFNLKDFCNSALSNFGRAAYNQKIDDFQSVLLLTETSNESYFEQLHQSAQSGKNPIEGWSINLTEEACSLRITNSANQSLFIIAGSQIIVEEDLEVLALATTQRLPDGLPLAKVIHEVVHYNGIPVIPWGFGKWMGRRGKLLSELLEGSLPVLFLGDNSGRPNFWVYPPHFIQAKARQFHVLPGTDPLPFRSEVDRPGRFGFSMQGSLDPHRPAASLKQRLLDPNLQIQTYGSLENPFRFFRNQISMQIVKRTRKKL